MANWWDEDPFGGGYNGEDPFGGEENPYSGGVGGGGGGTTANSTAQYGPYGPPPAGSPWQGSSYMYQPGGPPPPWAAAPGTQTNPNGLPGGGANASQYASWLDPSDPQGSFQRLVAGKTPNSATLVSLKPYFDAVGWSLESPNAAGITHKIRTPQGVVRVGGHFDSAPSEGFPMTWEWVGQGGGGSNAGGGAGLGPLTEPWNEPFNGPGVPDYQGPDVPNYGEFQAPDQFQAPDPNDIYKDDSYKFRVGEGENALENSAAAQGRLLEGGYLKDLLKYGQQFGSNEYGNIYNRKANEYDRMFANKLTDYTTDRDTALGKYGLQKGAYDTGYQSKIGARDRAYQEYLDRRDSFYRNQGNAFDRLAWQTGVGSSAASL